MPTCTISYTARCRAELAGSLGCKRKMREEEGDGKLRMSLCVCGSGNNGG